MRTQLLTNSKEPREEIQRDEREVDKLAEGYEGKQ